MEYKVPVLSFCTLAVPVSATAIQQPVLLPPLAHAVEYRYQRFSALGKAVFDLRRNLRIFLSVYEPVGLELLERRAERLVRNAADIFFHLVEAHDAELHQSVENRHFIFPVYQRERVAESRLSQRLSRYSAFSVNHLRFPPSKYCTTMCVLAHSCV